MNKVKKTIHVGLGLFIVGGFSVIHAQPEEIPERGPIPFSAYDRDGNGYISEQEFNSTRSERMQQRAAEGRPMRGAAGAP
ncbi:MAG TPA: EF-hand domain-containing protein, partial [Gammaproteobacteria bacterium]|nr:EF-hand domain-containing protein [Gammaproteobacteria bacterium]